MDMMSSPVLHIILYHRTPIKDYPAINLQDGTGLQDDNSITTQTIDKTYDPSNKISTKKGKI